MNPDENSPITNTVNTNDIQRGSWLKEIILPFIGALLFMAIISYGVALSNQRKQAEYESIVSYAEQNYQFIIDGIAVDSNSIKDIKAFQNNYYILHIDENNKTISAEHKGQK